MLSLVYEPINLMQAVVISYKSYNVAWLKMYSVVSQCLSYCTSGCKNTNMLMVKNKVNLLQTIITVGSITIGLQFQTNYVLYLEVVVGIKRL